MVEIIGQHIQKVHHLRLIIDKGEHNYTERILKLRVFIKLIQDYVRVGVLSQLNHDSHTFTVRLVAQIRDTVDFFQLYQIGNL